MRITIDTKEDSVEDIKRLIDMLNNFVTKSSSGTSEGFFNMFGETSSSTPTSSESPTSNDLLNMFNSNDSTNTDELKALNSNQSKKKEDRIDIIPY